MVKKYTVKIDRNLCIGAGSCVAVAPKAWKLDDEAKAVLLDTWVEEDNNTLLESAKACPVAAISVFDENGKQIFP